MATFTFLLTANSRCWCCCPRPLDGAFLHPSAPDFFPQLTRTSGCAISLSSVRLLPSPPPSKPTRPHLEAPNSLACTPTLASGPVLRAQLTHAPGPVRMRTPSIPACAPSFATDPLCMLPPVEELSTLPLLTSRELAVSHHCCLTRPRPSLLNRPVRSSPSKERWVSFGQPHAQSVPHHHRGFQHQEHYHRYSTC